MVKHKGHGKTTKNNNDEQTEDDLKKIPHSLVFNRGHVGKYVANLVTDMRRVMEPYTGSKLKVRRNNVLKDFVNIAGPLNITHFLMFTKTSTANYMRVMRIARGPTLTFKVKEYTLSRDIVSTLRRHAMDQKQFTHHPLLVMNGFSGNEMHLKLMTTMFQNLFPSINVNKVSLKNVRRCVLLNYHADTDTIEFRHYNVKTVPVGMSRNVKKLIRADIPDMGKYEDVSEYMLRTGQLSESEAELDGDHNEVVLPQQMSSRGNIKSAKSAIRLTEIGPRMTLELVKIEDGLCDGEVLHHKYLVKTAEEKEELENKRQGKKKLKAKRTQKQDENVRKKKQAREENRQRSLAGMKKKSGEKEVDPDFEEVAEGEKTESSKVVDDDSADDDAAYYRAEVGEEPEPEMFPQRSGQKRKMQRSEKPNVKRHKDSSQGRDSEAKDGSRWKKTKKSEMTPIQKIKFRKTQKLKAKEKKSKSRKGHARARGKK